MSASAVEPLRLSSTGVVTALGCLAKYRYRHVLKLVAKPENVSTAIRKGIWIHAALEQVHQGKGWGQQLTQMSQWALDHGVPKERVDELSTEVVQIVNGYLDYWREHERHPLEPVAAELPLEYRLPSGDVLSATLDAVVRQRGELYILETKSTQRIPDANWRTIDPQTAIQYLVARLNGMDVVGVIFNYLSTKHAPVPQVLKNGQGFYARGITTTSIAFEKGCEALAKVWPYSREAFVAYCNEQRQAMVRDDEFYLRETIYKPDALVAEVLRDVRWCYEAIRECQRTGHWPRNVNLMTCGFCTYAEICPLEAWRGGQPSNLRETNFVLENEDLRSEGRRAA